MAQDTYGTTARTGCTLADSIRFNPVQSEQYCIKQDRFFGQDYGQCVFTD